MEIFKLFGSILVDSSKAEESISKTGEKAEGFGKKLQNGIATAGKWALGVGAAAVAVGGAMMAAAGKVASTADEIDKASRRAGTSAENWQKLNYAFGQSGIESSKLEQTMIRNQRSLNDAAEGSAKASEAYERLGVSIKDADGNLRDSDAVYQDALNNLADLEDKNLRNAIANDIFGKSYGDLAPILDAGSEGISDLMGRAEDLGLVLSQDTVDAGVKFGDTMDDLKQIGGALFNMVAAELLPVFQGFADWIIANLPQIQATSERVFGVVKNVIGIVVDAINWMVDTFRQWYEENTETIEAFEEAFLAFFEWLREVFDQIVEVIQVAWEVIQELWDRYGGLIMAIAETVFDAIRIVIETTMNVIKGIINTVLALLKGDWEGAWNGIKEIVAAVWNGIIEYVRTYIENMLNVFREYFGVLKDIGKEMFENVWEGLKGVWTGISNWVSEKVDWLADKLAFWRKSNSEMGGSGSVDGSHATGLAYVPFNGYRAELHEGEQVLTRDQARDYRRGESGGQQGGAQLNVTMNVKSAAEGMKELEFYRMRLAEVY